VIRLTKYAVAIACGIINIVLFGQTFISVVGYHLQAGAGLTPGQVALVSLGPVELVILAVATVASWRSDNGIGPTRVLCWTLGGECTLNWAIFILGGGLFLLFLGI
jgi:hypothetical protein